MHHLMVQVLKLWCGSSFPNVFLAELYFRKLGMLVLC